MPLLGIAGGCVSVLFSSSLLWLRLQYRRLPKWTLAFQPATGGLAAGVLALYSADVLGAGYAAVELALHGALGGTAMFILLILKLAATVVCYSSGNAGGIFGPSLFLGAMLGRSVRFRCCTAGSRPPRRRRARTRWSGWAPRLPV